MGDVSPRDRKMGRVHTLNWEQWLPVPRAELFPFFADAGNLETLTPPWLNFRILTPRPIEMRAGAIIDYELRLYRIPIRWRTLISEWEPPERFVDEQLRGPYRLWHHEHRFVERDGGTLILDRIEYQPIGGALTNRLFVKRDVSRIFAYRREQLARRFDAPSAGA